MPQAPDSLPHVVEFPRHPPSIRLALHHETSVSRLPAIVREAKEGKRFGSPLMPRLSLFGRKFAEFD
jgi:hypothetical protein